MTLALFLRTKHSTKGQILQSGTPNLISSAACRNQSLKLSMATVLAEMTAVVTLEIYWKYAGCPELTSW